MHLSMYRDLSIYASIYHCSPFIRKISNGTVLCSSVLIIWHGDFSRGTRLHQIAALCTSCLRTVCDVQLSVRNSQGFPLPVACRNPAPFFGIVRSKNRYRLYPSQGVIKYLSYATSCPIVDHRPHAAINPCWPGLHLPLVRVWFLLALIGLLMVHIINYY